MEWTTAKPKKTGYYWACWEDADGDQRLMFFSVAFLTNGQLRAETTGCEEVFTDAECCGPNETNGITAWYGPIEPPPLPEPHAD